MADSDLTHLLTPAARAFREGDDRRALLDVQRARDLHPPGTLLWAQLERLYGLLLIHTLREVEGTFALERADRVLDELRAGKPTLDDLEQVELL